MNTAAAIFLADETSFVCHVLLFIHMSESANCHFEISLPLIYLKLSLGF